MCLGLREAVAQAPAVEAEYRFEAQRVEAGWTLAAALMLREICESDLRPILPARVELMAVFLAPVIPVFRLNRFCLPLWLLTATETKPRPQSAERKEDYRD
jgi:hypothetical protein